MDRQEVYGLISGNRILDDESWPNKAPEVGSYDVGTYIVFMKGGVNMAINKATCAKDPEECVMIFLTVATVAVRCMEGHGVYPRIKEEPWIADIFDPLCLITGDRLNIYEVIDAERDYQDNLAPARTVGRHHDCGSHLLMLSQYVDRAAEAWTDTAGDLEALDMIRKIAAICVRCLEEHGAIDDAV